MKAIVQYRDLILTNKTTNDIAIISSTRTQDVDFVYDGELDILTGELAFSAFLFSRLNLALSS